MCIRKIISISLFVCVIYICAVYASKSSHASSDYVEKEKNISTMNDETQVFQTSLEAVKTVCKQTTTRKSSFLTTKSQPTQTNETTVQEETKVEETLTQETTVIQDTTETQKTQEARDVQDAIIIKDNVIDIFYGPANQENVDEHDVVQDTAYWTNNRSIFLFGHNTGSFECLKYIEVGETISLINEGVEKQYIVTRSEEGVLTEDGTDITLNSDGTLFVYSDFGSEDIRLSTCLGGFLTKERWIVIAKLTE